MGTITVAGVGWSRGTMTLEAVDALRRGGLVLLHTDRCGCAEWLKENGIDYQSLDALYEQYDDFDEHADAAASAVIEAAEHGDVAYVVADVRDRSVARLVERVGAGLTILAGPPVEGALLALARGETRVVEASDWEDFHLSARENCLVRELENRELAAEVKLRLMSVYPEEGRIWLLNAGCEPAAMPLYELDRADHYDHRTSALIPAQRGVTGLERYDFEHLNEIIRLLCGPGGCPWDRAQTHASLRTCMLEEAYEVVDAIDESDVDHLYDELGDVLMQVALHAEIARRHGEFDMGDVTTAICEKLISRHTHVFGSDVAGDPEQVLEIWNRNKRAERHQGTHTEVLRSVTRALPAMLRAVKVLKRSADAGLMDRDVREVARRCEACVRSAAASDEPEAAMGEALMDLAGLARLLKVDPEVALNGAINRFIERFGEVERTVIEQGGALDRLEDERLREYWDSVKL